MARRSVAPLLAIAVATWLVDAPASADEAPRTAAETPRTAAADYTRLRGELAVAASLERGQRRWGGLESVVLGAGVTTFSAYGYGEATGTPMQTLAVVGIVLGGLTFLGGIATVASGGRGGKLDALENIDALDRVSSIEQRLVQLERGLRLAAEVGLRARRSAGVGSIIVGAAAFAGGIVYASVDADQTRTTRNVGGVALGLIGVKYTFEGIAELAWRRTPAEILEDAWVRERGGPLPSTEIMALRSRFVSTPPIRF